MKTENKPQPFISKAQMLQARLSELQTIHEKSVNLHKKEINQLREKYKKQSQRLGGYVQNNKNYRNMNTDLSERNRVNFNEASKLRLENSNHLNAMTSLRKRYQHASEEIKGLKHDVRMAEENYNTQYSINIKQVVELAKVKAELTVIKSKWWFKIFNW